MTTVLSRGVRARRGGRRPGWLLLTALLVLAIASSSALVFTDRAELLKLAVILALWAAVAAAFVSVIYRRQSDADQARVRDLKLVYDLQLDREISARREYELTVESQLRRELASELRALAADEVGALRAELAALRTNLEILFDTELDQRPALETERTTVRGYSEWDRENESLRDRVNRVTSVRAEGAPGRADDSSIIDVPEEPLMPPSQPEAAPYQAAYTYRAEPSEASATHRPNETDEAAAQRAARADEAGEVHRGSHRRQEGAGRVAQQQAPRGGSDLEPRLRFHRPDEATGPRLEPTPVPAQPQTEDQRSVWSAPVDAARRRDSVRDRPPGARGGHWWPAETPDSTWVSEPHTNFDTGSGSIDDAGAADNVPGGPATVGKTTAAATPSAEHRGRHSGPADPMAGRPGRHDINAARQARSRQSVEYDDSDVGGPSTPPPADPPAPSSPPDAVPVVSPPSRPAAARHRSAGRSSHPDGPPTGGQSVADLFARLRTSPAGGGRRRRGKD